jgi:hypothetical protein
MPTVRQRWWLPTFLGLQPVPSEMASHCADSDVLLHVRGCLFRPQPYLLPRSTVSKVQLLFNEHSEVDRRASRDIWGKVSK